MTGLLELEPPGDRPPVAATGPLWIGPPWMSVVGESYLTKEEDREADGGIDNFTNLGIILNLWAWPKLRLVLMAHTMKFWVSPLCLICPLLTI